MTRIPRLLAAAAIGASMAAVAWLQTAPARAQGRTTTSTARDTSMTMALTGDSIITMKLSVHTDPQFTKMIDLIRGADAAFTNLEMLFHDYEPYPSTQTAATYMRADPALAKDLVWAGFDIVAPPHNHAYPYSI